MNSGGTVIQTITSAPFRIEWTPNTNFKFSASASTSASYLVRYTTTDNQILVPSSEPFDVEIKDNQYYGTYGIMTLSDDPTMIGDDAFSNNTTL